MPSKSVTIQSGKTGDLSFTANWSKNTYTITYNGNGATGGSTAETDFTYGNMASVRDNGFTRTNYAFTGWNTEADGSGTSYAAGESYKTNANLTLYAQWKVELYTLTWSNALSEIGSYLGDKYTTVGYGGYIVACAGYEGWKRIVYTDLSGNIAYADPYRAGSINVKPGTSVKVQMIAGENSSLQSKVGWRVNGRGGHAGGCQYMLIERSEELDSLYRFDNFTSATLTLSKYSDEDYYDYYLWEVMISE